MNEPVSPRITRSRRAPDKATILDAAARLFEKRGFRNTTMQDLADELGIAKPTLYVHARTKGDILEGIFERVIREADEKIKDAVTTLALPEDQLKAVIVHWTTASIANKAYFMVFLADGRELPPRVTRYFRRWSGDVVDRIRDIIRAGQKRGDFDPTIDPTAATFGIIGASVWSSQWFSSDGPLSADDLADNLYRMLLAGLRQANG